MDVRDESTTWVDWSRPGQRPMYGREDRPPDETHAHAQAAAAPAENAPGADESVEDVAEDNSHVRSAPAAEEPEPPTAPAPATQPSP
jgi:hypothetical protein